MNLPEPVGYLHRGNGGGYYRYDTGGNLRSVYAQAAGEHPLFTETQLRAEIEKRGAVLRVALEALERALSDDKSYIMESKAAIKAIQEILK